MAIDILVIGATGYTGKLVTRYLIAHRERESFSLGLAARNTAKLSAFVDGLAINPSNSVLIFGVRDIQDKDALEKLFRDNGVKVVLSTVGPFYLYGRTIVEACASTGVHYVDICGETPFVKEIIISFDYLAAKTGAILVPSGAFDSVPSDLLAYLSARTMGEELSKLLGDGDANGNDEEKRLREVVGVRDSHTVFTLRTAGASGGP
ncbi:saccharopine dehydrogenase [Pyrrhoderma noxium]|uniref:Saccharopine dehydrogenase n=1 Tax=Pyrrhoderma noxium TaxID=2282107 RepID=A0A286UTU4_9AGAM|nr:saccharopine dehydrogenase [Pyrrhoderma noxium]